MLCSACFDLICCMVPNPQLVPLNQLLSLLIPLTKLHLLFLDSPLVLPMSHIRYSSLPVLPVLWLMWLCLDLLPCLDNLYLAVSYKLGSLLCISGLSAFSLLYPLGSFRQTIHLYRSKSNSLLFLCFLWLVYSMPRLPMDLYSTLGCSVDCIRLP